MRRGAQRKNRQGMLAGLVVFAAGMFLLASCGTTKVTAFWKDEAYGKQPQKVLVQAMLKQAVNRRLVEDEFVAHFRYRGISAVAAYTVLPGAGLATKAVLEEQLKAGGFDALLLVRLTGEKAEKRVVPGTATYHPAYPPMAPRHGGWGGYYGSGYTAVYSPSYSVTDKFAVAETNLYDVATENLIWTASSETWVSESEQKLIKTYVNVMMDSLRKNKIVP